MGTGRFHVGGIFILECEFSFSALVLVFMFSFPNLKSWFSDYWLLIFGFLVY
jgi:hypothetical protein